MNTQTLYVSCRNSPKDINIAELWEEEPCVVFFLPQMVVVMEGEGEMGYPPRGVLITLDSSEHS